MFRPDYDGATVRLIKALSSRNISVPSDVNIREAVLDYFEDNDFQLAATLLGTVANKADWHYVEVGESAVFASGIDPANVAESLPIALGSVIDEIDTAHQYPDAIVVNDNAIEFRRDGGLMFRVGKVIFTDVDASMSARCEKLFKGIRRYGDSPRLVKRLQTLPQLGQLVDDRISSHKEPRGQAMIAMVENYPVFMRSMLNDRFGIDVQQSLALELSAAMFGAKSWNVIKAAAASIKSVSAPVLVSTKVDGRDTHTYYRSNSDAIIGFSNILMTRQDRERLVISFHGGSTSFKSVYMSAHDQENDEQSETGIVFHSPLVSMHAASEVFANDRTLESLNWVNNADLQAIAVKLATMIGVDFRPLGQVVASNSRSNEITLAIKDYLFTLMPETDDLLHQHLKVQKFASDGSVIDTADSVAVATYKAVLYLDRTGLVLKADYDREIAATFTGFNYEDAERLSKFSGIRLSMAMLVQPGTVVH